MKTTISDLQNLVERLNTEIKPGFNLVFNDYSGGFGLDCPLGYVACDVMGLPARELRAYILGILNFIRATKKQ